MRNRDRDDRERGRDRDDSRRRDGFRGRGGDGPRRFERRDDRPFERRDDRPSGPRGDRPFERRGDRPSGPRGDRPPGDRPFRPRRDRPYEPRDSEQRQPSDAEGGRPERPPRPFERGARAFDRGPRSFDRGGRPSDRGDRPFERAGRPFERGARRPGPPGFERRPAERGPARTADGGTVDAAELIGEGEAVVAGRRPVSEAFAARREARRLLVVPDRRAALESLVLHATTLRLPIVEVEGGTLTSLAGFDGHQGVALVVAERQPASVDEMLARATSRQEAPFLLILDSLEDPQNLGTLLRSAEACGVHGVIYPTRHAAPLTAAAIKASAGATEHLLLAPVDNLPGTLADLRSAGLRLVGADEGAALRYGEADLRGPLALVVGSEERGISGALRRRLDLTVRIPMRGRVASLNAAVAGSVLLFAAAEQRGVPETGDRPPEPPDDVAAEASDEDARTPPDAEQRSDAEEAPEAGQPPAAGEAPDAEQPPDAEEAPATVDPATGAEATDESQAPAATDAPDGEQEPADALNATDDDLLPGEPAADEETT